MAARQPTFYLSHGAGPWPYMTGEIRRVFAQLETSLKELPRMLPEPPRAIVMVSAHWEEQNFAVTAGPKPPMVYDFSGFPAEMYRIRYPAPGSPELAREIHGLLRQAGLATQLDPARGFDHGTYAVLAVAYPDAQVPVVQVSVRADFDPQAHLQMGRALAWLRDEGVLIVGSGSSYHNFRPRDRKHESAVFDAWLAETLVDVPPTGRTQRLVDWELAPMARDAHPREDHLVPLHAAVGAAENEPGRVIYREDNVVGTISAYRFG